MSFLVLQARPERAAADQEFAAILEKGGLAPEETRRLSLDDPACAELNPAEFDAVIVGGGPGCVSDENPDPVHAAMEKSLRCLLPQIVEEDIPYLGCCYGHGVLASHLGAEVSKRRYGEEIGAVTLRKTGADPLLVALPDQFDAFVGHKEAVQEMPTGAIHLAASDTCPIQMFRVGQNVYGTQFHPELDGPGLAARIEAYQGYGYFPPEDANRLIAQAHAADVTGPAAILRAFVDRYRRARLRT